LGKGLPGYSPLLFLLGTRLLLTVPQYKIIDVSFCEIMSRYVTPWYKIFMNAFFSLSLSLSLSLLVREVHVNLQQFCQTQAPSVIYGVDRLIFENLEFILSLLFLLHSLTKKFYKIKYKE